MSKDKTRRAPSLLERRPSGLGQGPGWGEGYSSPSSWPAPDVGAPPNIDGTPAGGEAFAFAPEDLARPADGARLAAARPGAFLAGFFAAFFLAPPAYFAALRFGAFFAVLPAAFLVVLVFFAAFFLAAILDPS